MKSQPRPNEQFILEMTGSDAKRFLLKSESYCNIDFPPYLHFGSLLANVSRVIAAAELKSMQRCAPRTCEDVNYPLLSNKDGRHAWRPLQLIHPALYVSLVNQLTKRANWEAIRKRFNEFAAIPNFKCLSIPVRSRTTRKDKAAQITQWWLGIEQGTIERALDYAYVLHADITDCYAAIYTHSIAWSIHGKNFAKANKNDLSLIGNIIDAHIQDMRHGQTNGIPQGSLLMDLISELVLGYSDLRLSERLGRDGIVEFLVLRYRDDYRIFVNNPQVGEAVLKALTEVMIELGLKLNTSKTTGTQSVVSGALKPDKLRWLRSRQGDRDFQKHLLVIHAHGTEFPNAGSLFVAMSEFYKRLNKAKGIRNPVALISIAVDIASSSPRTFPVCAAIVSRVLSELDSDKSRVDVITKIHRKLALLPNTGHMEVWLQRISHPYDGGISFNECLCQLVEGKKVRLWNDDWISSTKLRAALSPGQVVNKRKLEALQPIVNPKEIEVFSYERY